MQTSNSEEGTRDIEISSVTEFCEKDNIKDGVRDMTETSSSGYSRSIHQDPNFNALPTPSNQVNDPIELEISKQIKAPNYTEQPNKKFMVENANKKASTFEATTAEAELDMLLNSFSETIDLDTPTAASSSSNIDDGVFKATPQLPSKGPNSAKKVPIAAELDDALDDLLQDTSYLISHEEKPFNNSHIQSLSPHSGTNIIANDDFDSWLDSI